MRYANYVNLVAHRITLCKPQGGLWFIMLTSKYVIYSIH